MLVYATFSINAVNTFITFPLFMANGSKWVLKSLAPDAKEKPDDPCTTASLADTERKSFQLLWELFMVAYEGYFGFTASTLICIYKVPETIPIFAYSLLGLYAYKLKAVLKWKSEQEDDLQRKTKLYTILGFFLPFYGGYCALHLKELYWK